MKRKSDKMLFMPTKYYTYAELGKTTPNKGFAKMGLTKAVVQLFVFQFGFISGRRLLNLASVIRGGRNSIAPTSASPERKLPTAYCLLPTLY